MSKYLFIIICFFVCNASAKQGEVVLIKLQGALGSGLYAPEVMLPSSPKQKFILKKTEETAEMSLWECQGIPVSAGFNVSVWDHHPGIASSCVYWGNFTQSDKQVVIVLQQTKSPVDISVAFDQDVNIPTYFSVNPDIAVARMRKIDEQGEVFRWVFLNRKTDGLFVGSVANLQLGKYVIEILDTKGKVALASVDNAYPIAAFNIEINESSESVKIDIARNKNTIEVK